MVFISWVIPATRWRWPSNIFFKVTLNKGDNYTLRCSAQGQPNPRVSWSRRSGAELVRGYFKTFWMKRLTYSWSVGYDFDTFYPKKVQILTGFSLKSVNLDTFPLLRVIDRVKLFHTGKKWFLAEYSPMDTVYLSIVEKLRKISWPTLIRRDKNIRPP